MCSSSQARWGTVYKKCTKVLALHQNTIVNTVVIEPVVNIVKHHTLDNYNTLFIHSFSFFFDRGGYYIPHPESTFFCNILVLFMADMVHFFLSHLRLCCLNLG